MSARTQPNEMPKTLLDGNLQRALAVLDEIRSDFNADKISVPGIVVCGAQNAGKSALLESITGIKFPRGTGLMTRCPIIVQMVCNSTLDEKVVLSARKDGITPRSIPPTETDGIVLAITEMTEQLCGGVPDTVCDIPLNVEIMRTIGPTLTVIDLPGITHGNRGDRVLHTITKGMTEKYMSPVQNIILCVIPASEDFSNSETIVLAKEKDPSEERTIGVVTKCDMEAHEAANAKVLIEKVLMTRENATNLQLGFVAVRCRGVGEEGLSLRDVREKEEELFTSDAVLKTLPPRYWGTNTLIQNLEKLQAAQIRKYLPDCSRQLSAKYEQCLADLSSLPDPPADSEEAAAAELLRILHNVAFDVNNLNQGMFKDYKKEENLFFPALIEKEATIFCDDVLKLIPKDVTNIALDSSVTKNIITLIEQRKGTGPGTGMFDPNLDMLQTLWKEMFFDDKEASLNSIANTMADSVRGLLERGIAWLIDHHAGGLPGVQEIIKKEVKDTFDTAIKRTKSTMETYLKTQEHYGYLAHGVQKDFIEDHFAQVDEKRKALEQKNAAHREASKEKWNQGVPPVAARMLIRYRAHLAKYDLPRDPVSGSAGSGLGGGEETSGIAEEKTRGRDADSVETVNSASNVPSQALAQEQPLGAVLPTDDISASAVEAQVQYVSICHNLLQRVLTDIPNMIHYILVKETVGKEFLITVTSTYRTKKAQLLLAFKAGDETRGMRRKLLEKRRTHLEDLMRKLSLVKLTAE